MVNCLNIGRCSLCCGWLVSLCGSLAVQTVEFDDGAGAVLRIQPLRAPRDENVYECVARNSEGEVSVTAKLAIIRGRTHTHTPQTHWHTLTHSHTRAHPVFILCPLHWRSPPYFAHTWVEPSSWLPRAISCGCDNAAVPHPAFHCGQQPTVLFIVPSSVQPSVIWPPRTGRAGLAS